MATLTIRNLPEDVHDALRRQAAEHRRSMEAEAREVLQAAVARKPTAAERRQAIAELQAMGAEVRVKSGEPEGWSGVDEFLAEKRLEGAWEAGLVSDEERRGWLDRLGRFEVWPNEIETFVADRRSAQ